MSICPKCGRENPDGAKFCVRCGASMEGAVEAKATTQSAPAPDTDAVPDTDAESAFDPSMAKTTVLPEGKGYVAPRPCYEDPQAEVIPLSGQAPQADASQPWNVNQPTQVQPQAAQPGRTPGNGRPPVPLGAPPFPGANSAGGGPASGGPAKPGGPDLSYDAAYNKPRKSKGGKGKVIAIVAAAVAVVLVAFLVFGGGKQATFRHSTSPDSDSEKNVQEVTKDEDSNKEKKQEEDQQKVDDKEKQEQNSHDGANDYASKPGSSKEKALEAAQNYLSFTAFSHDGLIEQLEYEGLSEEDATYAADNCGADWNEQAVGAAKDYLEFMNNPSHDELVDQLKYDGFTPDQAEYGATHAGV